MYENNGLRLAVIISDGIRGHVNQSRAVAAWLSKLADAPGAGIEVLELEIPKLEGFTRWRARRRAAGLAKFIKNTKNTKSTKSTKNEGTAALKETASKWLELAEGAGLADALNSWLLERGIGELGKLGKLGKKTEPRLIFISAGSMPAFYNLALGLIFRCPSVTIMTPSVTGTAPFNFAIVPEHDYPSQAPNVMTTLGAPNLVVEEELASLGESLLCNRLASPPQHGRRWGVLIGGDDKNYRITGEWVRKVLGEIFREAESAGADLYVTTSRRTSRQAEEELKRMAASCKNLRYMLIASADPANPVPAILGACDEIFVTDDSVNMVSEAVTAGHRAVLLRAERPGSLKKILQAAARALVSLGALPPKALWGAPRFDLVFESFKSMGLLVDFSDWLNETGHNGGSPAIRGSGGFNEARRAAVWILRRSGSLTFSKLCLKRSD